MVYITNTVTIEGVRWDEYNEALDRQAALKMDSAAQRAAAYMVRSAWRRLVPGLVHKLSIQEGIGATQASAYIAQAFEPYVAAAKEPWERAQRAQGVGVPVATDEAGDSDQGRLDSQLWGK